MLKHASCVLASSVLNLRWERVDYAEPLGRLGPAGAVGESWTVSVQVQSVESRVFTGQFRVQSPEWKQWDSGVDFAMKWCKNLHADVLPLAAYCTAVSCEAV